MEKTEILEKSPLFRGISNIQEILSSVHHNIKTYSPEELVVSSGDECNRLLIVLDGIVKGEMTNVSGKTIKIEDIEAPRPLAPAFLFASQNKFPVDIIAVTQATILNLPKDSVMKLFHLEEKFLSNYLALISNRAKFLSDKIRFLSFQTIKSKIAHYLLSQDLGKDMRIQLNQSQTQIAELFGVTRPALARTLRELHNAKILDVSAKNIRILDIGKLKTLLS